MPNNGYIRDLCLHFYGTITDFIPHLGKRCNKLPKLFEDEHKRFDNILSSVEGGKLYSFKVVRGSKSFRRSFGFPSKSMASSDGDDGDIPTGRATPVPSNEG